MTYTWLMSTLEHEPAMSPGSPESFAHELLSRLGVLEHERVVQIGSIDAAEHIISHNPTTGEPLAGVNPMSGSDLEDAVRRSVRAFEQWREVPAPKRGEVIRLIGNALRERIDDLGSLVSLEMGKIKAEGVGEVQEAVDIADFAVGLSRQLYGLTMPSERPEHRMFEQWHPIGPVGVITAFNFPVAVWAWNAMIACACGDSVLWKPSMLTPLVAVATTKLVHDVMREQDIFVPTDGVAVEDLFPLLLGDDETISIPLTHDRRVPLISATGSCRMGREVAQAVGGRLGRVLLELGGNNALIVTPDADVELASRAVVFGSVGTAGQRCTTTRRLLCVGGVVDALVPRLVDAYKTVSIGNPLSDGTLMGPLISADSVLAMKQAIDRAEDEGCEILAGGTDAISENWDTPGNFVEPTIIRVPKGAQPAVAMEETFAPILYVFEFDTLEEAIAANNSVDQGLSSAIFTDSLRSAERFLAHAGSDCGIANVNIGTSGAEIGGAFGGEKDTGGGREAGSDSWKAYMRRQTCTINRSSELPLAQGISFG